jgi:hypothetical protein
MVGDKAFLYWRDAKPAMDWSVSHSLSRTIGNKRVAS